MTEQEDQNHSTRQESEFALERSRRILGAAFEFLGGVAHASAEAFQTANSHMSAKNSNIVDGMLKGNARFLEEMSHTMNAVAERLRTRHTSDSD